MLMAYNLAWEKAVQEIFGEDVNLGRNRIEK